MKIAAVTTDQIIIIDGVVAHLREIGGFQMGNGEWAVHFNEELGYGHIEYTDSRDNRNIDAAEFQVHYAWLKDEHQRYLDHQAAEAAANEPDPISEPGGDSGSV
ncbi:hypothetical protein [Vibrio hepatarius]|uniref:hypothetical protein n=1 Tax=Vibrio hepatarius TaxID=171383 RepID=UPI00148B7489|nr:hypothetical protein [Vibrio hepatarius]NOI13809.1 hypothetical protein [Vibrio hepatarius]